MKKTQNKIKIKNKNNKTPINKAIQLSGAGLQMGLTIYLGSVFGKWLDKVLETNFLMQSVTLLAIFISIFALIKQANKIND